MGALYFGIGKAVGSLVGGLVIDDLGVRNTFRSFSILSLITASIYFCFTYVHEKKLKESQNTDNEAEKGVSVLGSKDEVESESSKKKSEICDVKLEELKENDSRCT